MSHKYDLTPPKSGPPPQSDLVTGADSANVSLAARRRRCFPLDSRQGRSLRFWLQGLSQQGRLEIVRSSPPQADSPWLMARLPSLGQVLGHHSLWGYLLVTLESEADRSLGAVLLPMLAPAHAPFASSRSASPGLGPVPLAPMSATPLLALSEDCPFVVQLEAVQSLAQRASVQWELALMDYEQLLGQPLRPSQALQYFDHLLALSPLPPSRTPASDRLLQRRQLLQRFAEFSGATGHSLWAAYCAMASWIDQRLGQPMAQTAEDWTLQTWQAANQWRWTAQALALDWTQSLGAGQPSPGPSTSPGQLAVGSSRALQQRIEHLGQLPANGPPALATTSQPSQPQLVTVEP